MDLLYCSEDGNRNSPARNCSLHMKISTFDFLLSIEHDIELSLQRNLDFVILVDDVSNRLPEVNLQFCHSLQKLPLNPYYICNNTHRSMICKQRDMEWHLRKWCAEKQVSLLVFESKFKSCTHQYRWSEIENDVDN